MEAWEPTYNDLARTYREHFSLAYLNTDIENKFALISLVCFLTKQARVKTPNASCYQVLQKIISGEESSHDMRFIRGLAVVCDDMMVHSKRFLTFDFKSAKEIVKKIKEILHTYLPFTPAAEGELPF